MVLPTDKKSSDEGADPSPTSDVVEVSASSETLTIKDKAGDVANRWLAKNRSLVLRQTPVWAQSLAVILISLGTSAVAAGVFFRIDEVVTATGQLKSIGGTLEVKTPVGGRVAEVFYNDGDFVEKGSTLVRFDTRKAAQNKSTFQELIALEEKQLLNQTLALESQKITLNTKKDVISKRLKTKEIILSSMKKLVEEGGFQKIQYLGEQDQYYSLQKELSDLDEQINRITLQSVSINLQSNKSLNQLKNNLLEVNLQLQYQNVIAPIDGVVFDQIASAEGVLSPGERIVSLVPRSGFYAEVFVPNKDIGFIKKGQEAKIRVNAFPFSRYGEIDGSVQRIGADALAPNSSQNFYRYPVKIKLDTNYLYSDNIKIPLKSGMAISTNLKLRDKPVISLVSDIFVDQTDSIKSLRQQ